MMFKSLKFENMSFFYESSAPLFRDVTFELPVGENVQIVGTSGAGQSTLLKIMAGLIMPTSGHYFVNGQDVTDMSFEEFLPFRKKIGYTTDFGGLIANRTLWDNMMLPLLYHNDVGFEEAEARVKDLFTRFGLHPHRDKRPASVSGGVRKACIVARAFVMDPEMLVLDDPVIGLARDGVMALLELIEQRRQSGSVRHVFFVTKDEGFSERLGGRKVQIESGALRMDLPQAQRKVANL